MSLTGYTKNRERYISTGEEAYRRRMDRHLTPSVAAHISAIEHTATEQRRLAQEKQGAEREQQRREWWTEAWTVVLSVVTTVVIVIVIVTVGIITVQAFAHLSHDQQVYRQAEQQLGQQQQQAMDEYQQQVAQAVSQLDAAAQPLPLQRQGWLTFSSTGSDWQTIHVRGYQLVPNPTGWSVIVVLPWTGSPYTIPGWAYAFSATPPGKTSQP